MKILTDQPKLFVPLLHSQTLALINGLSLWTDEFIMSPTKGEGDILFLVRILLVSASVSVWHFLVCTISHEPVCGF